VEAPEWSLVRPRLSESPVSENLRDLLVHLWILRLDCHRFLLLKQSLLVPPLMPWLVVIRLQGEPVRLAALGHCSPVAFRLQMDLPGGVDKCGLVYL